MPNTPPRRFEPPEVEGLTGATNPWQRQRQFTDALDVNEMAQAAATYRQAAAEAANTGQLSARADEVSQRAGTLDGSGIVDPSGRIQHTALGLQHDGRGMEKAGDILVKSMNWAIEEEQAVRNLVTALNSQVGTRNNDAQLEWYQWRDLLAARVNALPPRPVTSRAPNLRIDHGGHSWTFMPGANDVYDMPDDLAEDIRKRHLELARQDAVRSDGDVFDEIAQYRRTLGDLGLELMGQGYDLADGPLHKLWTGPAIAEIDVRMLREELAKPQPDPAILDLHTQGLRGIAFSVENPPGGALGQLDPDDVAYLGYFLNGIDPEMALQFGDQTGVSRTDIANGINMFTNPAIGGINPHDVPPEQIPQAVRPFVHDYRDSDMYGFWASKEDINQDLERFNRFGALMGSATVMPGHEMAQDLTRAAIDVQDRAALRYEVDDPSWLETPHTNTFSSDLLHNVSLNGAASNGILNDLPLRDELLGQRWERSEGVADVVTSGTTVPQDVQDLMNSANEEARPFVEAGQPIPPDVQARIDSANEQARPFIDAAYNSLAFAAHDPGAINGTPTGSAITDYAEHAALERAVGGTALEYMDLLSRDAGASGIWPEGEPQDIYGRQIQHGFNFHRDDLQGLFATMNNAEAGVRQEFFNGVTTWEQGAAYNAFVREDMRDGVQDGIDGSNTRLDELHTFRNIGNVAGTVGEVQGRADAGLSTNARVTALGSVAAAGGFVSTVADLGRLGGPVTLGAFGLSEGLRHLTPDPAAVAQQAQWDSITRSDIDVRTAVADAAVAARFNGAEEFEGQRPTLSDPRFSQEAVNQYADDVAGSYADYASILERAYNEANGT